jgi:prolyl oligopeptidase
MPVDARPTVAAPDDDPYVWLEEVDGVRALDWVDKQNTATLARFGSAGFAADRDTLAAIYDRPDNIPYITRRGPHLYNFWKDAQNPRGLWRRTTLKSFRTQQPQWEVVLDLDELAAQEREDWIWGGSSTLPGAHDRAIIRLSRGGGDAVVLREFDIPTQVFLRDGFYLPEAKGGIEWFDRDTLLLSSAFGEGMATRAGYARTVRLWRRGTEHMPVLFETTPDSMSVSGSIDRTQRLETIWFVERPNFFDSNIWLGDHAGPKVRLDLPADIWMEAHRGWLAVKRRTSWTIDQRTGRQASDYGIRSLFLRASRRWPWLRQKQQRTRCLHGTWLCISEKQNWLVCRGQLTGGADMPATLLTRVPFQNGPRHEVWPRGSRCQRTDRPPPPPLDYRHCGLS